MSEHDHHHDGNCHCKECKSKKEGTEKTSMEEAGGVAVGLTGHIHGYNADVEARLAKAMQRTGEWVEKESGSLLGHIKAAIYTSEGNGITLNLTDLESGVEHHGVLEPQEKVDFSFMAAVLDVDSHELERVMMDVLEDSGIGYHLNEGHHHHHDHEDHDHEHHHDEKCGCQGHDHSDHEHHHHHDDSCCCHDHKEHEHHHDHEHSGHEHHHGHKHDNTEEVCHCEACEDRRKEETERGEKSSFWDKIRRKKK